MLLSAAMFTLAADEELPTQWLCRHCGQPMDVQHQPDLTHPNGVGYDLLTCRNKACPMAIYTLDSINYATVDLDKYLNPPPYLVDPFTFRKQGE